MKRSLPASGINSLRHIPEDSTTSASPTRRSRSAGFQTWKLAMPVPIASNVACIWYAGCAKQMTRSSRFGNIAVTSMPEVGALAFHRAHEAKPFVAAVFVGLADAAVALGGLIDDVLIDRRHLAGHGARHHFQFARALHHIQPHQRAMDRRPKGQQAVVQQHDTTAILAGF